MASSFFDRIDELAERVGHGDVQGKVEVNQPYAQAQEAGSAPHTIRARKAKVLHWTNETGEHFATQVHHPGTPPTFFLSQALMEHHAQYLQTIADKVLDDGVKTPMAEAMEALSDAVEHTAPKDTGRLSESGHPTVTANGETVYDRAPKAPRMRED